MMPGSLSIRREAVPWNSSRADGYLAIVAIGVMAGVVCAYARMPLHLPGHKAMWWIPPVLAARLLTRRRAGTSVGALATIATTLSLGGRLAGGIVAMPLVILAGVVLDMAARMAEQQGVARFRAILVLSAGGAAGNLICFVKRLVEPAGPLFSKGNVEGLLSAGVSYAFFGCLAGAIGAVLAYALIRFRAPDTAADPLPCAST